MNTEQIKKLEKSIQSMNDKQSRLYFIVQDTKGNAKASLRYVYQMAMVLKEGGYNPIILHENKEYIGVGESKTDVKSTFIELQDENIPFEKSAFSAALKKSLQDAVNKF